MTDHLSAFGAYAVDYLVFILDHVIRIDQSAFNNHNANIRVHISIVCPALCY